MEANNSVSLEFYCRRPRSAIEFYFPTAPSRPGHNNHRHLSPVTQSQWSSKNPFGRALRSSRGSPATHDFLAAIEPRSSDFHRDGRKRSGSSLKKGGTEDRGRQESQNARGRKENDRIVRQNVGTKVEEKLGSKIVLRY